jgi:hypothetical protein
MTAYALASFATRIGVSPPLPNVSLLGSAPARVEIVNTIKLDYVLGSERFRRRGGYLLQIVTCKKCFGSYC